MAAQATYAFNGTKMPQQLVEFKGVTVCSGDFANGRFQPYVLNGNNYPVTVSFDIYCLSGDNGTEKYVGHYTNTIPANSGYVYFQEKQYAIGCYSAYPTNIKVNR